MTTLLVILEVSSCCLIRSDKSLPNKYSDSLSEAGSFSSVRLENSFVRQDRKRLRLCTLKPLKADPIHIRDCWSLSSTSSASISSSDVTILFHRLIKGQLAAKVESCISDTFLSPSTIFLFCCTFSELGFVGSPSEPRNPR